MEFVLEMLIIVPQWKMIDELKILNMVYHQMQAMKGKKIHASNKRNFLEELIKDYENNMDAWTKKVIICTRNLKYVIEGIQRFNNKEN
mgnify:CR=1 FL=1